MKIGNCEDVDIFCLAGHLLTGNYDSFTYKYSIYRYMKIEHFLIFFFLINLQAVAETGMVCSFPKILFWV